MKPQGRNSELSPLLKTPWDKGDRLTHKPAWSPEKVAQALRGIDYKDTNEFKESRRNGLQASYVTRVFRCGCTAFEDRGWLPCDDALHNALAFNAPKSTLALRLEQQRDKFDRVLAHAWSISEYKPSDVDTRSQHGISAAKYMETFDLG
ncbi:MAG TPA: hypothetical protein VKT72_08175 [Candidatus Baltobacteraceae bacterium]|nr:hypothetical protein [Candidatus Baltobacteraceae bacterium]